MDASVVGLAAAGAAIGLSASGSALGTGFAGIGAVRAWKKCFMEDKPAPFTLVIFVGVPLTQTFYGFLLMQAILKTSAAMAASSMTTTYFFFLLMAGLFGGLGIGASAAIKGKCAAAASNALAVTGKGFANYIMALGIIETVAIFAMVFLTMALGRMAG